MTNNTTAASPTTDAADLSALIFSNFVLIILAFIIITAVVGNFLVIYAFCACKRLRENVTNYFVVSLALSDLLTASLVMPFDWDQYYTNGVWNHGEVACDFFTTMYLLAVPGSIINLCAVTIDRFVVLKMPLRYKSIMPPRKAVFIILSLWSYALLVASLPQMGWKLPGFKGSVVNGTCYFIAATDYYHFVNFGNFLVPMAFVAFFWWRIYLIARHHFNKMQKFEKSVSLNADNTSSNKDLCPVGTQKKRTRRHLRGSRYIAVLVGLFFLCWLPHVLLSIVSFYCPACSNRLIPPVPTVFQLLGYLNSAMNPFLYPFHDRHYKKAIRDIFIKFKNRLQARLRSRCREP